MNNFSGEPIDPISNAFPDKEPIIQSSSSFTYNQSMSFEASLPLNQEENKDYEFNWRNFFPSWWRTTFVLLTQPKEFYRLLPKNEKIKAAILFALFNWTISGVLNTVAHWWIGSDSFILLKLLYPTGIPNAGGTLAYTTTLDKLCWMSPKTSLDEYLREQDQHSLILSNLLLPFGALILIILLTSILWLFALLLRGKGSSKNIMKGIAYAVGVTALLSWIPFVGFLTLMYMFYLITIIFRSVYHLKTWSATIPVLLTAIPTMVIYVGLIIAMMQIPIVFVALLKCV